MHDQRGLTLTEVTVTMVLASIVMFGLIGFYLNSQSAWMDASTKAITQREVTTLVETISERVHAAAEAHFDPATHRLELVDNLDNVQYVFWWNTGSGADSMVHEGPEGVDRGSVVTSKCERFECVASEDLVSIAIQLRSSQGDRIAVESRVALINREGATP